MRRASALTAGLLLASLATLRGQTAPAADVGVVMARVGAAVERYYERAQTIMWLEDITFQTLGFNLMPDSGLFRRLTYDLRLVWHIDEETGAREARVQRELVKINGRAPRPKDKPRCGDPAPELPDSLEFLLPHNQHESTFTLNGAGKSERRPALVINYRSRERGHGTLTEHEDDRDCVSMRVPGMAQGRIWIDPETADVLQVEEHLMGPVDMRWSAGTRNRMNYEPVTLERYDSTITFRAVTFSEPHETVMLPALVDSLRITRNLGDPRMRSTQRFSNYRRFTTEGRIVE